MAEEKTADTERPSFAESLCECLESWPFLALAGLSLAASFAMKGHGCDAHEAGDFADIALFAVVACGLPTLREALVALFRQKKIKASLLISCAMIACLAIGQVFAAGEVAFIMALGEALERITLRRAKKGLNNLVSLVPQTARYVVTCPKCLAKGEKFRDVPVESLEPGDGVRILPGETIPVDGVVTEGETTVDESVMTGESLPVDKAPGDAVSSGTINRFGAITVKVAKKGEDSSLQKMIRLVKEAQAKKAPVQRIADRWAAILVPASLALGLAVALAVWAWTGDLQTGLIRGVTILVVFCPCSLALATPTAIMAAIGQAAKYGVIVKSGEALEKMGAASVACMDKTGTLTKGKVSVSGMDSAGTLDEKDILRLAAAAETSSEHPLAAAIVAKAKSESIEIPAAENFRMAPGRGVAATIEGRNVLCGTAKWLAENAAKVPGRLETKAARMREDGAAAVFVAVDGTAEGAIALSDTVRDEAKSVVDSLKNLGVEVRLLTGDHESTAASVARGLGISDVRAGLLPEEKAAIIEAVSKEGKPVFMVGDGVNDAVALKAADVGIAMGGAGSDIAVEAADIALVGDDIAKIPYLKRLATACVKLIKCNIALSMSLNAVAIALSVAGLLDPVSGAIVHNVGSVLVVLNSALLYDRKFR